MSYGVVFYLVQLTVKNAILAANMVGERDGHSFDHMRMVLVVLLAMLGVALVVALALKASFDNNNYASVFLMALAVSMVGAVILILRFLFRVCALARTLTWHEQLILAFIYCLCSLSLTHFRLIVILLASDLISLQLWRHLAMIESSTGPNSNRTSIVEKIRPFLIFMVANVVCGLAAAVLQAIRAFFMISQFSALTQSPDYYTAEHYAFFDVFAPVRAIIYAVSIYYAWKPWSPSAGTALNRAPSSRPSPRLLDAAAGLDDRPACNSGSPLQVPFELMESESAAHGAGSTPPPIELESARNPADSLIVVVASSSDAD